MRFNNIIFSQFKWYFAIYISYCYSMIIINCINSRDHNWRQCTFVRVYFMEHKIFMNKCFAISLFNGLILIKVYTGLVLWWIMAFCLCLLKRTLNSVNPSVPVGFRASFGVSWASQLRAPILSHNYICSSAEGTCLLWLMSNKSCYA